MSGVRRVGDIYIAVEWAEVVSLCRTVCILIVFVLFGDVLSICCSLRYSVC